MSTDFNSLLLFCWHAALSEKPPVKKTIDSNVTIREGIGVLCMIFTGCTKNKQFYTIRSFLPSFPTL